MMRKQAEEHLMKKLSAQLVQRTPDERKGSPEADLHTVHAYLGRR
jgi:hypothetical protein